MKSRRARPVGPVRVTRINAPSPAALGRVIAEFIWADWIARQAQQAAATTAKGQTE